MKMGYTEEDALIISDHIIQTDIRGVVMGGLNRVLDIDVRLKGKKTGNKMKVTREAPATAHIDGNDTIGYIVARRATEMAIEKAKATGVAAVAASGTYYTGMLSYYAEMAAKEGLMTVIASNVGPWVAPYGSYKPLVGTNPFAIGIPSSKIPFIWDVGTSQTYRAICTLYEREGRELPPGVAYDKDGNSTVDPSAALQGALAIWGGAKGCGLNYAVQLLGIAAGAQAFGPQYADFGFMIIAVDPAKFRPIEEFYHEVDTWIEGIKNAPATAEGPPRVPFEKTYLSREQRYDNGYYEVPDVCVEEVKALIASDRYQV